MDNNGNGNIPTWVNIRVKLGDLKPWALNPRHITKKQAERLAASFDSFGQVETVAVSPSLDVYNGHQRLSVLHKLHGPDYEIDARQASRPLTDDERRKLVIYLHAGAVGGWDWDSLSSWPSDSLMQWGFDGDLLGEWKKDIAALGNLLESEAPEPTDAEPQIDRAEELNEKWQVKTGDLWRIGEHRLLCGDSTRREDVERVMQGENADTIITDPPYGIDLDTDYSKMPSTKPEGNKSYASIVNDDKPFDYRVIAHIDCKEGFWFGADYYAKTLPDGGSWLIWDKRVDDKFDAMFGSAFETIWSRIKHKREIIRCNNTLFSGELEARGKLHPTMKPTKVIEWITEKYSAIGESILDYFAGSGTTIVACQNLHRKCRAIEISPAYCAVALERMATAFPSIEIERIESSNASLETCNEQATN